VAIVVAVFGIVVVLTVVSVGVVVHLIHQTHFTRLGQLAQPLALPELIQVDDSATTLVASRTTRAAKTHRQDCLCHHGRFGRAACLVGSLTRPRREFIDAYPYGCQHRTSFPFRL
jgi:hypothetical protein